MRRETFRLHVEDTKKIIHFRFIGLASSKECTDDLLQAVAEIKDIWRYKQVWDYRRFDGILEPSDVERIALCWRAFIISPNGPIPTAVLANDPLTPARAKAYASLFPNLKIRSFTELNQALAWLDSIEMAKVNY